MEKNRRPKILLVKPILPYPPDLGTKLVSFGLIRALKERFDVTVLARILSRDEEPHVRELEKWCARVVTLLAPNRRSVFHRVLFRLFYFWKSIILSRPMKSLYECPGAFLDLAGQLSRDDFDLVVLEYWQLWRVARFFPENKVVLLTHDVEMLVNRQNALLERNLFLKIRAVRRWLLEQKEEVLAYRTIPRILALTERDRDAVKAIAGERSWVKVLPFGLEPAEYTDAEGLRNNREVLFLGVMSSSFNQDALYLFIRSIYPRIDHIDGLSVTIVGGELPKDLAYFASIHGVEVTGRVRDIRPFVRRAACIVIPLRFGGGLRTRVLEAMFAGLPVICSSVAMAGMPFESGKEYLLADTPDEFASQIERLLEDPKLAQTISKNARVKVKETYGAARQIRLTEALFNELIDNA